MLSKLVVANWKMNPGTYSEAERLAESVLEYGDKGVVLCSPYPWLTDFSHKFTKVSWGAQDVFWEDPPGGGGAYTGEISVSMLRDAGVEYVIVGHSEKRYPPAGGGDTDEIVAKKVRAVLDGGLTPIICVGERERATMTDDHDHNNGEKVDLRKEKEFVRGQLEEALRLAPLAEEIHDSKVAPLRQLADRDDNRHRPIVAKEALQPMRRLQGDNEPRLIVAYEPVWAISSKSGGVSDTPESAGEMIAYIKEVFTELRGGPSLHSGHHKELKVLYGGSVNGENAREFLERPEIDGVLVGSASLRAEEFEKIVEAAG